MNHAVNRLTIEGRELVHIQPISIRNRPPAFACQNRVIANRGNERHAAIEIAGQARGVVTEKS